MQIIVIAGRMGSGKSTVAAYLQRTLRCAVIQPLAKPIKDIAISMGWDGKKDKKGRKLLQLLGTECGRNCIDKDIWIHKWAESLLRRDFIIVDDLRFQSEYEFFKEFSNRVTFIHILRSQSTGFGNAIRDTFRHSSERGVRFIEDANYHCYYNEGSIEDLEFKLKNMLKNKGWI